MKSKNLARAEAIVKEFQIREQNIDFWLARMNELFLMADEIEKQPWHPEYNQKIDLIVKEMLVLNKRLEKEGEGLDDWEVKRNAFLRKLGGKS